MVSGILEDECLIEDECFNTKCVHDTIKQQKQWYWGMPLVLEGSTEFGNLVEHNVAKNGGSF